MKEQRIRPEPNLSSPSTLQEQVPLPAATQLVTFTEAVA